MDTALQQEIFTRWLVKLTFSCLVMCVSHAQEESHSGRVTEELRVLGSRLVTPPDLRSYALTVVDSQTLAALQPLTASEALSLVPGLHIQQASTGGGLTSLYIRGADPNFTTVMIDGVPLNDPTNTRGGSFDVTSIGIASIERIEIARGALSSIYGSDALAGAVNFVTSDGTIPKQSKAHAFFGSDGYIAAGANIVRPVSDFGTVRIAASRFNQGDTVRDSTLDRQSLIVSADLQPVPYLGLSLFARKGNGISSGFPDDSGGSRFAVLRELEHRDYDEESLAFSADFRFRRTVATASAHQYRRNEFSDSPGVAPGARDAFGIPENTNDSTYRRTGFMITAARQFDRARILSGLEWRSEDGLSDSTLTLFGQTLPTAFSLKRTIQSVFVEGRWNLSDKLILDWSLRRDSPDTLGSELSPRIALLWPTGLLRTNWHLSYSEGFKLPSFFALGNPIVGDSSLLPETSQSIELGGNRSFGTDDRISIEWAAFSSSYRNVIDIDDGPPPRLVNRREVQADGLEISSQLRIHENLSLHFWLAYINTRITHEPAKLRQRPKQLGGAAFFWTINSSMQLAVQATRTGRRYDSTIPTSVRTLASFGLVRMRLSMNVAPAIKLVFGIENAIDSVYEESLGFPTPGRQLRLGVVFQVP